MLDLFSAKFPEKLRDL